jgi:hypothetical protein
MVRKLDIDGDAQAVVRVHLVNKNGALLPSVTGEIVILENVEGGLARLGQGTVSIQLSPHGLVTVVKTMAGQMHRDEHHHQEHTDAGGEEDFESLGEAVVDRLAS